MKPLIITVFISFVFTSGRLYLALFLAWNELYALFVIVLNCRLFIVIANLYIWASSAVSNGAHAYLGGGEWKSKKFLSYHYRQVFSSLKLRSFFRILWLQNRNLFFQLNTSSSNESDTFHDLFELTLHVLISKAKTSPICALFLRISTRNRHSMATLIDLPPWCKRENCIAILQMRPVLRWIFFIVRICISRLKTRDYWLQIIIISEISNSKEALENITCATEATESTRKKYKILWCWSW